MKTRTDLAWQCRNPRGKEMRNVLGRAGLGFGGFVEPHDSEAGKAKADCKAQSKYIVSAELSLFNTHCKTQLQL